MIYLMLFILSFSLTYVIREFALKKSLLAYVNERSSHTKPVPHGGGIAIVITWFIGLIYLYINDMIHQNLFSALVSGLIISVVSYLDDLFELSAKVRLFFQALVAFLGLYFLNGLTEINLFIITIENPIIVNIIAFFIIIWFINLYNFLDGIDGYAGSEAIFLAISGYVVFGGEHFLVLAVAVLGFLIWNWHQAKIFMGDVGSTLLGYNIAIFTIYYANQDSNNLWIWIILFSLFWFDATLTLYKRKKNGEKLSQAHKKHAYQRLVQSGWKHDKVVKFAIIINIFLLSFVFLPNTFLALLLTIVLLFTIIKLIDNVQDF